MQLYYNYGMSTCHSPMADELTQGANTTCKMKMYITLPKYKNVKVGRYSKSSVFLSHPLSL
jgi:hypothetical protein